MYFSGSKFHNKLVAMSGIFKLTKKLEICFNKLCHHLKIWVTESRISPLLISMMLKPNSEHLWNNLHFANNMLIAFCVQPPAILLHSGGKFPSCLSYTSEMNITGTLPPLLLMAKSWSQILRDTSPRHACLGEVSRESASRQSRKLIMRSKRTTKVQRGARRESQGRVNLPFV